MANLRVARTRALASFTSSDEVNGFNGSFFTTNAAGEIIGIIQNGVSVDIGQTGTDDRWSGLETDLGSTAFLDSRYATDTQLDAETAARQAADATLTTDLASEVSTRTSADTTLQSNIDAETSARTSADATLTINLATEESARESADATLTSNLTAETNARMLVDGSLSDAINSEIASRAAADTTLQANINSEAATRALADTALGVRIDGKQDTLTAGTLISISSSDVISSTASISTLPDTTISSAANDQVLTFDTTSSRWVNKDLPAAVSRDLDSLTDVTITTPTGGQFLGYDSASSMWVNTIPSGIATNAAAIAANTVAITTNASDISTNTSGISNNASAIAAEGTRINTNAAGIVINAGNITTNAGNIATNTSQLATNTPAIASNASNIGALQTTVAGHTTDIATNNTGISNNATAIATKQDELIAGVNITITDNGDDTATIAASGTIVGQDVKWDGTEANLGSRVFLDATYAEVTALTAETSRATTAEGLNTTAITSEASTARAAEGVNATAITTEASTARAAEQANATAVATKQDTLIAGTNITITDNGNDTATIAASGGGGTGSDPNAVVKYSTTQAYTTGLYVRSGNNADLYEAAEAISANTGDPSTDPRNPNIFSAFVSAGSSDLISGQLTISEAQRTASQISVTRANLRDPDTGNLVRIVDQDSVAQIFSINAIIANASNYIFTLTPVNSANLTRVFSTNVFTMGQGRLLYTRRSDLSSYSDVSVTTNVASFVNTITIDGTTSQVSTGADATAGDIIIGGAAITGGTSSGGVAFVRYAFFPDTTVDTNVQLFQASPRDATGTTGKVLQFSGGGVASSFLASIGLPGGGTTTPGSFIKLGSAGTNIPFGNLALSINSSSLNEVLIVGTVPADGSIGIGSTLFLESRSTYYITYNADGSKNVLTSQPA